MAATDTPTAAPTAAAPAAQPAGASYTYAEAAPAAGAPASVLPEPVRTPAQRRWIIAAIAVATAIVLCGIFVSGVFLGLHFGNAGGGPSTSEQQQLFPGQQGGPGFGGNR